MSADRELYVKAALGDMADKFFKDDLGQYVIQKSLQVVADNQKRFAECKLSEIENIASEVHFNINVARKALEWLNEAINEGRAALQQLEAEEDEVYK